MLYQNKRAVTLHLVSLLTFALSVFVSYMIFSDLEEFFEEYSSKTTGIFWLIFMLVMGNVMLVCMFWLSGRYVLEISKSYDNEENIIVKTWTIYGYYRKKIYPKTILENRRFHLGKANFSHVPIVTASWYQLKTPKGKTLLLDLQGKLNPSLKKDYTKNNLPLR